MNLAPRKRWGQNFLVNQGVREKIIKLLHLEEGLRVWEIGPGLGAMSLSVLSSGAFLTAFEIDKAYCRWLKQSLCGYSRFRLVQGDFLSGGWKEEWNRETPNRIIGNLPYNAASAIIMELLGTGRLSPLNVFTVQDEMGQRMKARPETKAYASFSVICQSMATIEDGGVVLPGSFYPVPNVRSRIVILRPEEPFGPILNTGLFQSLVRALFSERRKTLANNLRRLEQNAEFSCTEALREAFAREDIDLSRRPETVPPASWVSLINRVSPGVGGDSL